MNAQQIKECIPENLNNWQKLLLISIEEIMNFHNTVGCPYGRGGAGYGCTKDVFFGSTKVMIAHKKPQCYCCGITEQVFWETLNQYFAAIGITEQQRDSFFTSKEIFEIHRYFFCRTDYDVKYKIGAPGAIQFLSTKENFPLTCDFFEIIDSYHSIRFSFGDFVQIHNPQGREDHSVIAMGSLVNFNGRPCLPVFSATSNYNDDQVSGPGFDWFYYDLPGRSFSDGRISE